MFGKPKSINTVCSSKKSNILAKPIGKPARFIRMALLFCLLSCFWVSLIPSKNSAIGIPIMFQKILMSKVNHVRAIMGITISVFAVVFISMLRRY